MFRNSIPPPRPYNPPSFDDIFGGGGGGGENGRSNSGEFLEEDRVRDIQAEVGFKFIGRVCQCLDNNSLLCNDTPLYIQKKKIKIS